MVDRDDIILQLYSRAHAPNRDYYGLTITNSEIILNTWNITHGPHKFPKKQKCPLDDVQLAKQLQNEIQRLYGNHVLEFVISLSRKDTRLECMPTKIFLKILRFLATNDILKLGQTSKIFFELCSRNDSWGIIFTKRNKSKPSRDERKAAETKGWRLVLKNKIMWADRVQRIGQTKSSLSIKDPKMEEPQLITSFSTVKKLTNEKKSSVTKLSNDVKRIVRPISGKKPPVTVPEVEKYQLTNFSFDVKEKSPFTMKIPQNNVKTAELSTCGIRAKTPISKSGSSANLPLKGILKNNLKNKELFESKTTSKLAAIESSHKNNIQTPSMTTIAYKAISKPNLLSMSSTQVDKIGKSTIESSKTKAAKNLRLEKFLADVDKCLDNLPFNTGETEQSAVMSNSRLLRTVKNSKISNPSKSKQGNGDDNTVIAKDANTGSLKNDASMTSKFEDYLNSLKNRYIHSSVDLTVDAGSPNKLSKSELIPKIKELGKSMNEIRSSFYSTDGLKMSLNNNKKLNKNVQKQPLNNKKPNPTSSSCIDLKKNMIKNNIQDLNTASASKVKNTNVKQNVKPTKKSVTSRLVTTTKKAT